MCAWHGAALTNSVLELRHQQPLAGTGFASVATQDPSSAGWTAVSPSCPREYRSQVSAIFTLEMVPECFVMFCNAQHRSFGSHLTGLGPDLEPNAVFIDWIAWLAAPQHYPMWVTCGELGTLSLSESPSQQGQEKTHWAFHHLSHWFPELSYLQVSGCQQNIPAS